MSDNNLDQDDEEYAEPIEVVLYCGSVILFVILTILIVQLFSGNLSS